MKKTKQVIAILAMFCVMFTAMPMANGSIDSHAATNTLKATATCNGWTGTIALRWNKISDPEQGYAVIMNGKVLKHFGKTTTYYAVTGLKPGTKYSFRIRTWKKVRSKMWYNTSTKKWQWTDPGPKYRGKTNYGMRIVYGKSSPLAYGTTAKAKYTITYNANGGTGAPAKGTKIQNTPFKISTIKPKRSGYTFTGWTIVQTGYKNLQPGGTISANSNANYTLKAQWSPIKYTITWKNYDGTTLTATSIAYNTVPKYTGSDPVRPEDEDHIYTFSGWTPDITAAKGNKTYTAVFTAKEKEKNYTVTWKNYDGTVLGRDSVRKGTIPEYRGTPERPEDDEYTYTFGGWTPEVSEVTSDVTYTAVYRADKKPVWCNITWKDFDGTVLDEESVLEGETPVYNGETPAREDDEYTYTFSGWTPEVTEATSDAVYTAVYESVKKPVYFNVIWKNFDGTVLCEKTVAEGEMPVYDGEAPVKEADDEYTYTFSGWTPEVTEASSDTEYTAVFEAEEKPVAPPVDDKEAARIRLETAIANLAAAEEALNDAESDLEEARALENQYAPASEEEIAAADQKVEEKRLALEEAERVVAEKQAVCDNIGKSFLESKAVFLSFDVLNESCLESDVIGSYVGTDQFNSIMEECLQPENIRKSIDFIRESNVIRQNLGLNPYKISSDLMIASIYGDIYYKLLGSHAFALNCSKIKGSFGENLARSTSDPFGAWYYEEKMHYLADQNGTDITTDILNTVKAEANANNSPFERANDPGSYIEYLNRVRAAGSYATGHYTNLIDNSEATGFAWAASIRHAEQSFSGSSVYETVPKYTYVDEYGRTKTRTYVIHTLDLYDPDTFESQLDEFVSASAAELDEANAALTAAQEAYDAAIAERNALDQSEAWENAVSLRIAAEAAYNTAKDAYDAALEEKNAAQEAYDTL